VNERQIRYTRHALTVMQERGIDQSEVEQCVSGPDWIEPDPRSEDTKRYFRSMAARDGRCLRVVLVEMPAEIRIVSAFLDRRAKPK
jgi:hypothetical protein